MSQYLEDNPSINPEKFQKFIEYIHRMPPTGTGKENHAKQFGAVNLAKEAGVPEQDCVSLLIRGIDDSERPLAYGEVEDTVNRVYHTDVVKQDASHKYKRKAIDGQAFRDKLIAKAEHVKDPVLWLRENSSTPKLDRESFFSALYAPDDILCIGSLWMGSEDLITAGNAASSKRVLGPSLIANPLTGTFVKCMSGKLSCRCDAAVASHKYLVCEIDGIDGKKPTKDYQIRLWIGAISFGFKVVSMIWSGSKSIHALLYVPCKDKAEWKDKALGDLFYPLLVPMGVDSSCQNPSRLTRAPDATNEKTTNLQEVLYLNQGVLSNADKK